ncbi:competence protein CoiA [Flavobacterium luteolum]|uniref:competence protein CoiA n=1 Tax=Flavobacterium luteolum TaxID=3003259 RepID=UPI00248F2EB3|nr:competence protein CoiA family protein [Flavobacterium luteolum]
MSDFAVTIDGEILDANLYDDDSWNDLKKNYEIGKIKMICCDANAIPKTSMKFTRFFAHQNGECATAPETVWHKTAKRFIINQLSKKGITAVQEKIGPDWIADIYFEINDKKYAIEIQRSPQTLPIYLERQAKYNNSKVEAIWLLKHPRYKTLTKAIYYHILKKDYNNKFPSSGGIMPSITELPVFYIDESDFQIKGVGKFDHSIPDFISAVVENTVFFDRWWKLRSSDSLNEL